MTAEEFRAIVSGERHSFGASLSRALLRAMGLFYGGAIHIRNFLYDHSFSRGIELPRPAISVGNITLGGTGKSPMIAYLTGGLLRRGHQVGILSRGYGAALSDQASNQANKAGDSDQTNDEAAELRERFPEVPHYQAIDRVRAGQRLLREYPQTETLLLDDAFQYRRLKRSIDLVLIDATEPFGYGAIFPRGFLREPISSLRRADVVILTRADLVSPEEREKILCRIRQNAPSALLCQAAHEPTALVKISPEGNFIRQTLDGRKTALEPYLHDSYLFCGIGNPEGFFRAARQLGIDPAGTGIFPDHYPYTQESIDHLEKEALAAGARQLLTTMKDLVKFRRHTVTLPCAALEVGIRFLHGEDELWEKVLHSE